MDGDRRAVAVPHDQGGDQLDDDHGRAEHGTAEPQDQHGVDFPFAVLFQVLHGLTPLPVYQVCGQPFLGLLHLLRVVAVQAVAANEEVAE